MKRRFWLWRLKWWFRIRLARVDCDSIVAMYHKGENMPVNKWRWRHPLLYVRFWLQACLDKP